MSHAMECPLCGVDVESREKDGFYADGDEYECPTCKASLSVTVHEDGDAYFRLVKCAHGRDEETPCEECENL